MTGDKKKPAAARRAPAKNEGQSQAPRSIENERELVALCLALLGPRPSLSPAERVLARGVRPLAEPMLVERMRDDIHNGADPLGEVFLRLRTPAARRGMGAVYTPDPIIHSMLVWAAGQCTPQRVVDPGAGSGRYLVAAAKRFPGAQLVGVELDPLAALMLRANIAVHGLDKRATVLVEDFRLAELPRIQGRTLYLGTPPYVRHHDIGEDWKQWFAVSAKEYGVKASKLAGLHIHFFLRALQLARPGDVGTFITSAEWLDVNYGATLRRLLAERLGGVAIHVLDARARPFEGVATTGAITCFKVGEQSQGLRVRSVESLETLNGLSKGDVVPWEQVRSAARWSPLFRPSRPVPEGYVELGELCRVHRGQVTGGTASGLPASMPPTFPKACCCPPSPRRVTCFRPASD
ncbi:Eco57I restriction-modification methylase domain-containing protein [Xanthomonas massiliensis]|uniref:Eco57I restriction-modification methylase domain-containing protein n=1 Tax=Xanthomonas massiliensis TaxID=1720302 RepID=UPI000B30E876|nr:N-6 DNA methylase [Xanthomonas massiliensis]